jgi:Protein of unknown function (DUF4235)
MAKLLYKPIGLLVSVLGGMLATATFNKLWKLATHEEEAPKATDAGRRWPEILAAAALHGAFFAVVKATLDRATAAGTQKLTGTWPGDGGESEPEKRPDYDRAGKH